jgi:predicted small lipoprotein YifL
MLRDSPVRYRNVAVTLLGMATIIVIPLAGCGVKGPLKLPQPQAAPSTTGGLPSEPPTEMGPPAPPATPTTPERKP